VSANDCVDFLRGADQRLLKIGEATAVIAILVDGQVWGASVGDCEAWLISTSGIVDLTRDQRRKPLLGSGHAIPIGFGPLACTSRLLLGSDGLFKYVPHERIRNLSSSVPLAHAAAVLVDAARLPSGALQDDVAVIVAG
jgi:serine/threonine protein phosphatase PrpC